MSKKWIFLICVLSLASIETSQAHPLDSRDIVYIDGVPCNSACQSYMAWSRQALAASGHQAASQPQQRPASAVVHRATTTGKQVRVARQVVPLPPTKMAMVQPADKAADKLDGTPDKPGAEANFNTTNAIPEALATAPAQQETAAPPAPSPEQKSNNEDTVVASRSESVPPADAGKAAPAKPDNDNTQATLPAVGPATDLNIRTLREQVTAAATIPAPDLKTDSVGQSVRPEAIGPDEASNAAAAPPFDVAGLPPSASAAVDSNTGTIRQHVIADTVIAEHVMTLRDAEKAASGSPVKSERMDVVVITRPEINAISDLAGKDIAIEDRYSASGDQVRTAIAAAGAIGIQLSSGQTKAIDRLIHGEVPAAVLTLLYPETGFPEFEGFKIFRIPLGPGSPTARLKQG